MPASNTQSFAADSDAMQRFTATGRPYKDQSQENSFNTGMNSIAGADTFGNGNGPANVNPFRYTDDSTLTISVLKVDAAGNPEQAQKKKGGFLRKLSLAHKDEIDNATTKQVTRGDYLKYYAKDDDGKFVGTEKPAADCILRLKEDLDRWGRQ